MIHRYCQEDEASCLAVFSSNSPAFFDPGDLEEFHRFLRSGERGDYYVFFVNGDVRACGGWYVDDKGIGGLTWGMVRTGEHRRGIGSELLRFRLDAIRRESSAWCVVLNTTQSVAPFFERFGFQTFRLVPDGYGSGLHKVSMRIVWDARHADQAIAICQN